MVEAINQDLFASKGIAAFIKKNWPLLFLPILIVMNYFLRHNLEHAGDYIFDVLLHRLPHVDEIPFWRLLLPLPEHYGSWMSSSLVLTHKLQLIISPEQSLYLENAILIIAAFFLTYTVFHSYLFSFTVAICLGFGTQYYHMYNIPTLVSFYLYTTYLLTLFVSIYKFVISEKGNWIWFGVFILSLLLTAMAYEGWLDAFVFLMLASIYGAFLLIKYKHVNQLKRLCLITILVMVTAGGYIFIKSSFGYGQTQGSESDLIFNYLPEKTIILFDLISNYLTLFYMTVTNYLPSIFIVPWDLIKYGNDGLIAMQFGYHRKYSYFVPMNMVFYWRYFVGIFLTIFIFYFVKVIKKTFETKSENLSDYITITFFMIMMATAGPTHNLVKFRPMHSLPFLNYHVVVGIIGSTLLIAYLLLLVVRRTRKTWLSVIIILGSWSIIFYGIMTRPTAIEFASKYFGMNDVLLPNPLQNLIHMFF